MGRRIKIAILFVVLTTAGCSYAEIRSRVQSERSSVNMLAPRITPTVQIQITPTVCPWNWAYQADPNAPAYFQELFRDTGMTVSDISAQAFGETGGPGCSFHKMDYESVSLTISDPAAAEEEALGKLAMKAVKVLRIPIRSVVMTINGNGVSTHIGFLEDRAYALLDQNLNGKAFLEALKNLNK